MAQQDAIRQIKELHKEAILTKPNVVGVGIGEKVTGGKKTGELSVVVLVRQKTPPAGLSPGSLIPKVVGGVKTDVLEVGDIRALQARTDRWRPAPGGVSLGHYQITAGTLGCVVRDRTTGTRLILSNNHVLANSNAANIGDPILQNGPADGGQVGEDTIAHLERYCPIQFNVAPPTCNIAQDIAEFGNRLATLTGSKHQLQALQADPSASNLADAAVARPTNDSEVLDEILDIGLIDGVVPATLGMPVRKSGRTTALTTGEVTVIAATVTVSYGPTRSALFENQIITGPMSQGGDSGSLVVAGDSQKAVGLLFAGSEQTSVANPIQAVLDNLEVVI